MFSRYGAGQTVNFIVFKKNDKYIDEALDNKPKEQKLIEQA